MNKYIGAAWVKEGRNGKFMSGNIEIDGQKVNFLMFKNDRKRPDRKDPDYQFVLAERQESKPQPVDNDDDVPF